MSKHTPEPWRVGRPGTVVSDTPVPGMGGSDAVEYYGGHLIGESIIEANARRIVACVNALKNVSTEWLEAQNEIVCLGSPIKDRFLELEKQRDELLGDIAEESAVREKLATLLAETAVALKGPEAALFRHSWHDLADVAAGIVKQRDELLAAAEAVEIDAEECMDFDDCTGMFIPIDSYHKLMEAIANVKGETK